MCDEKVVEPGCPVDYLDFSTPFRTTNGVMMGDPGTKGLLTLLCLAAEEEANMLMEGQYDVLEDHYAAGEPHRSRTLEENTMSRSIDYPELWIETGFRMSTKRKHTRIFSTAGDDQEELGSHSKLLISDECHHRNFMVTNKEKKFLSPIGGIYCERLLLRTRNNRSWHDPLNGGYEQHYMVDSIKIRLISPCNKAQEGFNEPNPAIGKSKVLSEQLRLMPRDWQQIAEVLVPNRFLQRMYKHIPRTSNGSIDQITMLPLQLGGMGLKPLAWNGFIEVFETLSEDHVFFIKKYLDGDPDSRVGKTLSSFLRDRFARGVRFDEGIIDSLFSELDKSLNPVPIGLQGTLYREGIDTKGVFGFLNKKRKLQAAGYVTDHDLKGAYSRTVLQTKLLTEKVDAGWVQSEWPARRNAYERSFSELRKLRVTEGRDAPTDEPIDRLALAGELMTLSWSEFNGLGFNESLFYKPSMTALDYHYGDDVETLNTPIDSILESLVVMDLPPVIDKRWRPS
jgi:hypothetical protein